MKIVSTLLLILVKHAALESTESFSEDIKKREPGFLFTFPKTMLSERNESVCISIHEATTPAKVLVDLKIKEKHHVTSHTLHSEHSCFEIPVPKIRNHIKDAQYASIHLQVQLNNTIHSAHGQDPILIYTNENLMFVETDRNLYKPGDRVKIRILCLTQEIKAPEKYIIPIIKIQNPIGITVTVWENVPTELGLVQLEHQLSQDTTKGKWKVVLNDISKTFEVKEHILPRFKIHLNSPIKIYNQQPTVKITICAKYSYGRNVKGVAGLTISFDRYEKHPINRIQELRNGCTKFEISNGELKELADVGVRIMATVTEHGTNQVESVSGKSYISNRPYELKFADDNLYFKPGLAYHGRLQAIDSSVDLSASEKIEICYNVAVGKLWNIKNINQCSLFTFEHGDTINFYLLPLEENVVQINLYAKSINRTIVAPRRSGIYPLTVEDKITAYLSLKRWYSPSSSFIHLEKVNTNYLKCRSAQQLTVFYTTAHLTSFNNLTFYYMIKSRSKVYKFKKITHIPRRHQVLPQNDMKNIIGSNHSYIKANPYIDKFILKFKLDPKIISKTQLLVYYVLPDGEIVAATVDINIEKCLLNKVEASWSDTQKYPGESVTLNIKTDPNSLCALSAVDKSISFLEDSKTLDIQTLLKPFVIDRATKQSHKLNCIPNKKRKQPATTTEQPFWNIRKKRSYRLNGMIFSDQLDTYDAFSGYGISVITNLKVITKPCVNLGLMSPMYHPSLIDSRTAQFLTETKDIRYEIQNQDREIPIRSFFPDTWLWELVPVNQDGQTKIKRDLPHSITTWMGHTMCVSPTNGLGLSSPMEITAFQPFFLEVLTPFSIKRNEILHLQVVLFNYLNYSLPVRITLGDSPGLELFGNPEERNVIHCIQGSDSKSTMFRIKGSRLGKLDITVLAEVESSYPGECGPEIIINKRDVVYKTIYVESQGYSTELTKSTLLCANDSLSENNVTWNLMLPSDVVPESLKGKITVSADLLGPTIQNIEKLLSVPTGCGEQIMATLAPNLYILRYLNSTRKLSYTMHQRMLRNLKIGYQRILEYIHKDGSFSAFGYHDPSGSMFLTSFVVRTLQQAKAYIYIDQNVVDKAVQWIINHQLENGCFSAVSHVFHDMGGTSTENSTAALTSYVLISLLESNVELSDTVRMNAQYCIRGHFSPDKYTLAISTYALSLVGWQSEAKRSLERLLQIATVDGSLMWWSSYGSPSTNIEMSAYVLLSLLYQNTTDNLVQASSVVRWLSMQRNSNGGFITTQDTVVALDALSRYAVLIKNKDANVEVEINENKLHELIVNSEDRLTTKQIILNEIPKSVKINVKGQGCVFVQAFIQYNLYHMLSSEAFKLAVEVEPVSTVDKCSVATVSPCLAYTGPGLHSNMAVLEVTMPSGYEPDRASLYKLVEESNTRVKRFEELSNQVILYFTELNNEPICVPFNINENSVVEPRVDAIVKLYDYYNPALQISTTYKVNTCQPNHIASIPPLPGSFDSKINNLTNDYIAIENMTQENVTELVEIVSATGKKMKREVNAIERANINGLNPDFINLEEDMAVPEGIEGNKPIYLKNVAINNSTPSTIFLLFIAKVCTSL